MQAQNEFLIFSVKLIKYIFSADSVWSNPCVGPLPQELKHNFLLLSILVDELISAPKIITFLPVLPLGCEKNPFLSNAIPYPEHLYQTISTFLVNVTAPYKQFSSVG